MAKEKQTSKNKISGYSPPRGTDVSNSNIDRFRLFSCCTYIPPDDLQVMLNSSTAWIRKWAYIYHDCDTWEKDTEKEGQLKEPHIHLIVHTYHGKTCGAIEKLFSRWQTDWFMLTDDKDRQVQNTLVQPCRDIVGVYRYFTHADNPDRYQYPVANIVHSNFNDWQNTINSCGLTDSSVNLGLQMTEDVLNGATSYEMTARYGKEWIYHRSQIIENCCSITREESTNGYSIEAACQLLRTLSPTALAKSGSYSHDEIELFFIMLDTIQYGNYLPTGYRPDKICLKDVYL